MLHKKVRITINKQGYKMNLLFNCTYLETQITLHIYSLETSVTILEGFNFLLHKLFLGLA
jgi:hypothetical protein